MTGATTASARDRRNRRSALRLAAVTLVMFGFGFALVPLYDVFCEITGLNGKTGRVEAAAVEQNADLSRTVTVEFVSSVNGVLGWEFVPEVTRMKIHPGRIYEANFSATNRTSHPSTGQAVPSVSPSTAARYFNKTECFCFTRQELGVGEHRRMPVRFVVDRDLPEQVHTITLSYTFFDAGGQG